MEDKYYKIDRCSNSELSRIKRELQGQQMYAASEASLLFGRMFHYATLEPRKYDPRHVDMSSRILLESMCKTLRSNFQFNLFANHPKTTFEEVVVFNFETVRLKCKLDARLHDWIIDPKSTSTTSREEFIKTFDDYGYWRQAFLYMFACRATRFTFFGVTKSKNNCKLFVVNAHEFPHKLKEAEAEAKLLTKHYVFQKQKAT